MLATASSLLALALATTQGAPDSDWLNARGTESCSVSSVDFTGLQGFAAGSFNCGLLTDDGGYSWTPVRVMPQMGQSLMWAYAAGSGELFAARNGLFRSRDSGATWSEVGALSAQNGSMPDLLRVEGRHWVAIKGGQLLTSDDDGDNWIVAYPGEFNVNFHQLHFPTPQIGYASGGIARQFGSVGNVLRTDDGGANWTMLDFEHGKITAADFVDADHALVATQSEGLFVTADGAQTWQPLGAAPGAGLVNALAHRDALHWYAITTTGCLYESFDGGLNWEQGYCDRDERVLASLNVRGGAAVAAGNDGLVIYENRIFRAGFDAR